MPVAPSPGTRPPGLDPVRVLNRATGRVETEAIYGEAWLRWAYETPAGRAALRWFAARPWFSRWYGWRMDRPSSRRRIAPFIRDFGLDPKEFADPPESFRTFNEFFSRRLRPDARPVLPNPSTAVFPADGRHLGFRNISTADRFFVKGQKFDLEALIADPALARRFSGAPAVFSRLCPVDYHRFHFPVDGIPGTPELLNGWLWSVNPIALRRNLSYLWTNRRWRTRIESPRFGEVLMFEIGATNVGSTEYTFTSGQPVTKGEEKGYFRFGGSAVLTLFTPGRIALAKDLLSATSGGLELYAHVGDALGHSIG